MTSASPSGAATQQPLSGLTVIECASVVAGPLAVQYLADMGANVIKIEPPEGDLTRAVGPRRAEALGSFFLGSNRNKRSVVLDLKRPQARAALQRMVAQADVFLHSMRTVAAEKLGITYEALSAVNPRLVHCHVQGFSDDGPYGGKPAYDDIVQSLSGLASLQSVVGGEPRYMPSIFADKVTAIHAAYAVSLGLLHRERTGVGQALVVPMFETMAGFNVAEHLWGYSFQPPLGPMGYEPVSTAARRPFPTQDGYISFLPYSDRDWRRFFELIGDPAVMEDERFATYPARQANVALVWTEIARRIAERTNAEWMELLGEEDLPFAVVNTLEDLVSDPHLEETGFWQTVADPDGGLLRFPSSSLRMSRSAAMPPRIPPKLGADTDSVLREFGFDDAEVADLMQLRGSSSSSVSATDVVAERSPR